MESRKRVSAMVSGMLALVLGCSGNGAGSDGTGGTGGFAPPADAYPANVCVGAKQTAAGRYCRSVFDAWAAWDAGQDAEARVASIEAARASLSDSWSRAEAAAADSDADCSSLALTADEAGEALAAAIESMTSAINDGLDLEANGQAECGAALLAAAGGACSAVLGAEGQHIADIRGDSDGVVRDAAVAAAFDGFSTTWAEAASGDCPTSATPEGVRTVIQATTDELVTATIVAPGLDDAQYSEFRPGETRYLGATYTPTCLAPGSEYVYFAKRGSTNNLLYYFRGGGACWNALSCTIPTCTDTPSPPENVGDFFDTGLADFTNEASPFRDWNVVFVSYCTCDNNFGDATVEYSDTLTANHRGYQNTKIVEKWAREHFLNPEQIFVIGQSAGSYAAMFHAPALHDVWPASQIHVLGDGGSGVITEQFLAEEITKWNYQENLPDIPGVQEALTGGGISLYVQSVAPQFPDTNWAHYSTVYDGGPSGQTGFFNTMLNDNNPLAAQRWWEASCLFGETNVAQSQETYDAIPDNYRYYFGTGSGHTGFRKAKAYYDTSGGVPTLRDWIATMLEARTGARDGWTNVLCEDCNVIYGNRSTPGRTDEGDHFPEPIEPPFQEQGDDIVIVCE